MAAAALPGRGVALLLASLLALASGQGLLSRGGARRIVRAKRQAPQAPADAAARGLALDDVLGDALGEPEGAAISLMQERREKIRAGRGGCRGGSEAERPGGDRAAGFGDAALAAAVSDGLEDGTAALSLAQGSGRMVLAGRPAMGGAQAADVGCVDRAVTGLTQAVDPDMVDMMLSEEMDVSLTQVGADIKWSTAAPRSAG